MNQCSETTPVDADRLTKLRSDLRKLAASQDIDDDFLVEIENIRREAARLLEQPVDSQLFAPSTWARGNMIVAGNKIVAGIDQSQCSEYCNGLVLLFGSEEACCRAIKLGYAAFDVFGQSSSSDN